MFIASLHAAACVRHTAKDQAIDPWIQAKLLHNMLRNHASANRMKTHLQKAKSVKDTSGDC